MIGKADIEDIPKIREMAEVVFRQTYATILSPEQMEYMMDMMYSERSLLKQMERDIFLIDKDKGYVSYHYEGFSEDGIPLFHLEKLYVMPSERNNGLGRKLFDSVVADIRSRHFGKGRSSYGKFRIELNVNRNNPAVFFYEHIGMHKSRSGDFPIGSGFYMNDYIMSIDLELV